VRGFGITDAPWSWIVAGIIALLLAQSTGIISFFTKGVPGESSDIPHARRVRAALQRELPARAAAEEWAVVRIMWKELLRARDVSRRN
jgi:hypothetical protein